MPNISASSYNQFSTCQRLYYFEQVLKLQRAKQDGARGFGTMYHAGLEAWWKAMDGGDVPWRDADGALVAAIAGIAEKGKHIDTDPYERGRAEAMMVAYHARYFELDFQSVQKESVEVYFAMPLRDHDGTVIKGWRVTGKLDAFKRFKDGRTKPVEHKQTGSEIHGASDYWARLSLDTQVSIYVDHARFAGIDAREALYDVSRRPELRPLKATPDEKRKMTKGKGCPHCGGRAGGKHGAAPGTGKIMITTQVDADGNRLPKKIDVETACTSCEGTGWQDKPRLQSNQRNEDESVIDFKLRVAEELASMPDKYFRQGNVPRSDEQLAEMRGDLVMVSGIIGANLELSRKATKDGDMTAPAARRCWSRNTQACTNIYGRRCDFLDVCTGVVPDPMRSLLYQIGRPPSTPAKTVGFDDKGKVVSTSNTAAEP
jgi:hypothetical protein